jgi:threonine/homoserine/homoserine lactone efflux protein
VNRTAIFVGIWLLVVGVLFGVDAWWFDLIRDVLAVTLVYLGIGRAWEWATARDKARSCLCRSYYGRTGQHAEGCPHA